jgi:hypothetical protein
MSKSLYMVIERFKNGDAVPVYRRFRDQGRLAPEGLFCVSSCVDTKLERCYQVMETDKSSAPGRVDRTLAGRRGLRGASYHHISRSAEAAERIVPHL